MANNESSSSSSSSRSAKTKTTIHSKSKTQVPVTTPGPSVSVRVEDPLKMLSTAEKARLEEWSTQSAPAGLDLGCSAPVAPHTDSSPQLHSATHGPIPPPPNPSTAQNIAHPVQFPNDEESVESEYKLVEKAWELASQYNDCFIAPEMDKPKRLAPIGRPSTVLPPKRPVSTQTTAALDLANNQHSHPEGLLFQSSFTPLLDYSQSFRSYNPTNSVLDLYRIKKSGISGLEAKRPDISISGDGFRELQRRSAYLSDMSNFLSMITQASHSLIALGSLSDEQASHLKALYAAQCILSRDLSVLAVTSEVDLNHLRRKACLAKSSLDKSLQERLLTLPVDDRHLFGDTAAVKMVADHSSSPAGLVSALTSAGVRFHPYPRQPVQRK